VQPLESVTDSRKTLVQLFSQHQRQKAAKHVAGDVDIVLVKSRAAFQKLFHITEHTLHPPQFLVLESGLFPPKTIPPLGTAHGLPKGTRIRMNYHTPAHITACGPQPPNGDSYNQHQLQRS
jgi:hypothetical protein